MGLARQIRQNIVYRGIFILFQFLNTMLISRLAGPLGFGQYALLVVNANFLLTLTSLGLPSGILFHASSRDMSPSWLLKLSWTSTTIQLVVIGLAEWLLVQWKGNGLLWDPATAWLGIGGIAFTATIILTEKYYALFNGYGSLLQYHKILAVCNMLLALVLLVCRSLIRDNANVVIHVFVGIQVLQLLVLIIWYAYHQPRLLVPGNTKSQSLIRYSLSAYISNLLYFLMTRIDMWMVEFYGGTEMLGLYALPIRLIQMTLILPGLLAGIVLPKIASGDLTPKRFESVFRILATLNLLVLVAALVLSPWLLPLFFGEQFLQSVPVLLLLWPGAFFLSMQIFLAAYFAGKGQMRINLVSMTIGTLVALALYRLLIPGYSILGAGLASTLAYAASFIYSYRTYCQRNGYRWQQLIVDRNDLLLLRRLWMENKLTW